VAAQRSGAGPQARIAPRALGPRASTVADPMASVSFSTSPQVSAASIQPRKPIPVVATTKSSGAARHRSVASRNSVSSASGTMRIAGAYTTRAPRRSSAAPNSSRRRAAVTATE